MQRQHHIEASNASARTEPAGSGKASGSGSHLGADSGPNPGSEPELDPTKVLNQPALRRSSGTIWLVMGALFLLASLFSFGVVIAGGSGASTPLAVIGGAIAIALYGAMVLVRLLVADGPKRLRLLAACMLTMALVSLVGVWVCAYIEAAAATATLDGAG